MVCESCMEAIREDIPGADDSLVTQLAIQMGRDVPDHNCEEVEIAEVKCSCACRG